MQLTDYFTFSESYIFFFFCLWRFCPFSGHRLPFHDASRYHSDILNSVGRLWMSDQPDAESCTWQRSIITPDKHPCPRWDSKPQSQQTNGRRLKP